MKMLAILSYISFGLLIFPVPATVDDARSFALEAAAPIVQNGYEIREACWSGELRTGIEKTVVHQLFKGNEYWFFVAANAPKAKVAVHIYDANGILAEQETWEKSLGYAGVAAAFIVPKRTGTYYLVLKIESSPAQQTHWAMVYAYR